MNTKQTKELTITVYDADASRHVILVYSPKKRHEEQIA